MAKVHHRVGIVGDIKRTFKAIHEPSGLSNWWASNADGEAKIGGIINLHFEQLTTLSFKLTTLEENASVKLKCTEGPIPWHDSTLSFTLTQDKGQV